MLRMDFEQFCARSGAQTGDLKRVLDAVKGDAWCAGGAVRRTVASMSLDSDFDFFFRSQDHLTEWEGKLPGSLALVRETAHHKHWRGPLPGSDIPVDVQAIKFRFYENAESVIDSFDYTITMFALDGATLVTTPEALWDLGRRRLAVHKVTYPVATMRRMLKYGKQGFTACSGCMAELFRATARSPDALSHLDIAYID